MRSIAQKLQQAVGDKRPCVIELPAQLRFPPYLPTATIPVRIHVGNWTVVSAVERMVRNGVLRPAPVQVWDESGLVTRGVQGMRNGRTVMTITATRSVETLLVRIGAFDRRLQFGRRE
ncbi:hypothetical protein [Bradyrhizobium sp.]|uniref:hypothetical protein n=1 Tax=Bradyrhizobium sp. TaxID=376 RepID=UPI001ECB2EE2|nr:hypothetical protein [Bradyrhizobium sp.]MBV9978454.1 hypothetical protein [Bradyrhizobium sp.]